MSAAETPQDTSRPGGDPLVGSLVGGRYRIQAVLGRGAVGVVYEALHEDLGRPSALKVLGPAWASDESAIARFQREARAASSLGHPNIVTIYDFGRLQDGRPYLAMERLRGESLADALAREGRFDLERVARLVCQIANALDAVHAEGLVHRDIKPDNIFLARRSGASESVQLLDFGLAAFSQPGEDHVRLTMQGQVHGTPFYMAPEVASSDTPLTLRADVYALGVVAFEMIAGALPFDGSHPMHILHRKCRESAPSMFQASGRSYPGNLEAVIARALEREPELRPRTAGAFARELWHAACPNSPYNLEAAPTASVRSAEPPQYDSEPPVLPVSPIARALPVLLGAGILAAGIGAYLLFAGGDPHAQSSGHSVPAVAQVPAPTSAASAARGHEEPASAGRRVKEGPGVRAAKPARDTEPVAEPKPEARTGSAGESSPEASPSAPESAVSTKRSREHSGRASSSLPDSTAERTTTSLDLAKASELRNLGVQALMRGQLQDARNKLDSAVRLNPKDASAWRSLGLAHERLKNAAGAASAYRNYLKLAPEAADASSVRARLDAL